MKRDGRKLYNQNGTITVFLAIILFTIISFILVLVDVARINAAKNQLLIASDNAAESVMASYNKDLFNEYGLFAFNGGDSSTLATTVFERNIKTDSGRKGILDINGNAKIENMANLFLGTDVFKQQMIYAMKYQGTENLAINVYDKIARLIDTSEEAEVTDDLKDIQKLLEDLNETLGEVEDGKLNAQRGVIGLRFLANDPEFYILDKYDRQEHFYKRGGPYSNYEIIKLIDKNIGKTFFSSSNTGDKGVKINNEFINNPYQNAFTYKYAVQMAKSYLRSFEEEYNNEKSKYATETKKYNDDLKTYNTQKDEWDTYDKEHAKWKKEHDEWESKKKNDPNFTEKEPQEPKKPSFQRPTSQPTAPNVPEILNMDLNNVKSTVQSFCVSINNEANNIIKDTVDNDNKRLKYYYTKIGDAINSLEDLKNSTKRAEIIKKLDELEAKANNLSDMDLKKDILDIIEDYRVILDDTNLDKLSVIFSNIRSKISSAKGSLCTDNNSVINKIDSIINSSTIKITEQKSKDIVGPFMDQIYSGMYKRGSNVSYQSKIVNAVDLVKKEFVKNNKFATIKELDDFKKKLVKINKDVDSMGNLDYSKTEVEVLDIGEKEDEDSNFEDTIETLSDDDAISSNLDDILQELSKYTGVISLSPLPSAGGTSGSEEDIDEFKALSGYKDAFSKGSYDESLLDKLYLCEYIMTNYKDMARYVDEKNRVPIKTNHDSVLEFEIEAIIRANGVYDDQKNKDAMVDWIKKVRTACNVVTIFKTKKMKDFTYKSAEIICTALAAAFSLFPFGGAAIAKVVRSKIFIKIVQLGLIYAWASNEAELDTADLLRGFYVPLIKEADEWVLTLGLKLNYDTSTTKKEISDGAKKLSSPQKGKDEPYNKQLADVAKSRRLLMANYPDYLRVRLLIGLLTREEEIINAVKDITYGNMDKVTGGNFNYNDYYAGMKISVDSSVNTWFDNNAFGSGGRLNFNKFSYLKRYN